MKALDIAYYTVLRNFRDWKFFLLLMVAPLFFILVVGNASIYITNPSSSEITKIGYLNDDRRQASQGFDQLLASSEIAASFDIQPVTSNTIGIQMVKNGSIEAFIYIPQGFSDSLSKGQKTNISLYSNNSLSPAKLLVKGFINSVNTESAVKVVNSNSSSKALSAAVGQIAVPAAHRPRDLDNKTYLIILMFLFFGGMLGSFSIINGIKKNTRTRLDISPIGRFVTASGQYLGNLITLFITAILLMFMTSYVYGANWNGNHVIIVLTFLFFSAITIALGMVIGHLTRKSSLSVLVIVCLNIILGDAGLMESVGQLNSVFKPFTLISPHYYSYVILKYTIFGGAADSVPTAIISMAGGAVVLTTLAIFLGRRKAA
mgnify:CR=1 FL=1